MDAAKNGFPGKIFQPETRDEKIAFCITLVVIFVVFGASVLSSGPVPSTLPQTIVDRTTGCEYERESSEQAIYRPRLDENLAPVCKP